MWMPWMRWGATPKYAILRLDYGCEGVGSGDMRKRGNILAWSTLFSKRMPVTLLPIKR